MKARHVSFTGTRAGMTNAQKETVWALLQELGAEILTHGNCIGADADAHDIAERLGLQIRKRPSNILDTQAPTFGGDVVAEPDEPLKRDRDIVDDGEVLVGCPDSRQEKQRSGTWYTMRYAWGLRRMVYVVFPDGGVACGTSKEECGPDERFMQIVDEQSTGALNHGLPRLPIKKELLIKCSCGYYFTHDADHWKIVCENHDCGLQENLTGLLERWKSSELLDRLGKNDHPAITLFRDRYFWLSNFAHSKVCLDGVIYSTVENAYQAAKTNDLEQRKAVFVDVSPGDAKRLGRKLDLRPDWEIIKLSVMENLLEQKFGLKPNLVPMEINNALVHGGLLKGTGRAELVEGNTWGDRWWGVDRYGWNHLGRLLMKIRSDLRSKI